MGWMPLAGRVRNSGVKCASRRPGQTPDHYPATERKVNQATRKKPEVNLAQTAAHGRGGLAGCLGSGWVSDNPSNKTRKSLECGRWPGSPRARAALAAWGKGSPLPCSGEVPQPEQRS